MALTEAFQRGYNEAETGYKLTQNPYKMGSKQARQWIKGWWNWHEQQVGS